ncbi:hypothetical protein [Massilia endophytica]|uniref:hypothetical protein n=1 Tax=Massilia endophytica TaxID=2899220 RepID=UPI001E2CCC65|nr:hypothetical protein [Massilia endophytica]UGQ47828.1 hypothetical protein LSQ66_04985 [Massilia endophytica]
MSPLSRFRSTAAFLALAAALAGCAVSREDFRANPQAASNYEICKALQGEEAAVDRRFVSDLNSELLDRRVSPAACGQIVKEREETIALAVMAGAVVAAAAVADDEDDRDHRHRKPRRDCFVKDGKRYCRQ